MESEDLFSEEHFAETDEPDLVPNEVLNEEIEGEEDVPEEETTGKTPVKETAEPTESNAVERTKEKPVKLLQLPLSRIRNLMKLDPDLHIASNEAVYVVTRATELFIESFAREAFAYTTQAKKKTIQKRDIDLAIAGVDSLLFLDGAMNFNPE